MKSIMNSTDRGFIVAILMSISIVLFLLNIQSGRLEDRVEALERIEAIEKVCKSGQRISIDTNMSHYSDVEVDDRAQISNNGTAYIGRGFGEYHIVSGTPGGTGRSYIDIPTGDWTPTRGKAIGIRIGDMPYNVHISDPMRN